MKSLQGALAQLTQLKHIPGISSIISDINKLTPDNADTNISSIIASLKETLSTEKATIPLITAINEMILALEEEPFGSSQLCVE